MINTKIVTTKIVNNHTVTIEDCPEENIKDVSHEKHVQLDDCILHEKHVESEDCKLHEKHVVSENFKTHGKHVEIEEDSLNSLEDQASIDRLIQTVNNTAAYKTLGTIDRTKPVGYIRGKVFSRNLILKILIDSGNLYGDLISEELARLLKLQIVGHEKIVGTAAQDGKVTVLGRTKPFRLYLEGIKESVLIQPHVVRALAHPINLGQAFLRRNLADMSFKPEGVTLKLKNDYSPLEPSTSFLNRSSIDTRITDVLNKFEDQGKNPYVGQNQILDMRIQSVPGIDYKPNKTRLLVGDTLTRVCNVEKIKLKANHSTVVQMYRGKGGQPYQTPKQASNNVAFIPKNDNKFLNKNMLFAQPGILPREGNTVNVMISNFNDKDVYLPMYCNMGQILEVIEYEDSPINQLSHNSPEELSNKELAERKQYLKDTLKLENNPMLTPETREKVIQLFLNNFDAVAISDADFGKTNLMSFTIKVEPGAQPVRHKIRPLNPFQEKDLKRQLDDWLEAGVIEESMSPWSAALVPVKKKSSGESNTGDKWRWCLDYRGLNKLTIKDSYALPNIDSNLHKLGKSSVFSVVDSSGAFLSLPIRQEDRDYTSFSTIYGSYRFNRMPFGVCNGPASYSRLVQMALDRLPVGFSLAFIDDLIIYSKNPGEHLTHLQAVLEVHVKCGMKLNLRKCSLFQSQVEYLGHLVSKEGISMVPSYVERILQWPLPETGKELRSCLGFFSYYRSFIKEFADLTCEMQKLKNSNIVQWTEATKQKFYKLKQCFKEGPVRGYPDYESKHRFILDTDWSATNFACVLSQMQDGQEKFLGCVAKKCNKTESSYSSSKGELGSLFLGLRKFEHVLRAKPFLLRTDSQSLKYLATMTEYRGIYSRWNSFISSFDFEVEHRPGRLQVNADALSRVRDVPEEVELPEYTYMEDADDIYNVRSFQSLVTDLGKFSSDQDATANIDLNSKNQKPEAKKSPSIVNKEVHVVEVPEAKKSPSIVNKEVTLLQLKEETAKDFVLAKILSFVKAGKKPDKQERKGLTAPGMCFANIFECLSEKEGILFYEPPTVNDIQQIKRMCLPVVLYDLAFYLCHNDPTVGHFGQNNTYLRMKKKFYFPQMYSYISARVNNCVECIKKRPSHDKANHMMHREQLSYLGQRVCIDVVGPLTASMYRGNMCTVFLTIQDSWSRYLMAIPMQDQKTPQVVAALVENWIYMMGVPETIHSDQGSNFNSNLFKEVMKSLGIVKTNTPKYSPEGNGRLEHSHSILGNVIRSNTQFQDKEWPQKLALAVMCYNSSINRNIGLSPHEVIFGRPMTIPLDLMFPFQQEEGVSWASYVTNFREKFSTLAQAVCLNYQTSISRANAKFQARSGPLFEVGDMVYYFLNRVNKGLSKKLGSRWLGPNTIVRVVSDSLVVIMPVGNWCKNARQFSTIVNRLKKVDRQIVLNLPQEGQEIVDMNLLAPEIDEYSEVISYQTEEDTLPTDQGVPEGRLNHEEPEVEDEDEDIEENLDNLQNEVVFPGNEVREQPPVENQRPRRGAFDLAQLRLRYGRNGGF